MMLGYEGAFPPDADSETVDSQDAMPRAVRLIMKRAAGRSWKHLADERIEGIEPKIPLGRRFWPLTTDERNGVEALFAQEGLRRLATSLRSRKDDASLRALDAAYWRKGCSSLGKLRIAALIAIDDGEDERHCLMDIIEAVIAAAPCSNTSSMPTDAAERVVMGARNLSRFLEAGWSRPACWGRTSSSGNCCPRI